MAASYLLSLDQGTTSTRAVIFDAKLRRLAWSQRELPQHYPQGGWVEHDPEDIWDASVQVCRAAVAEAGIHANELAAVGITNQRETVVIWDRLSGRAIQRIDSRGRNGSPRAAGRWTFLNLGKPSSSSDGVLAV